MATEEFPFPPAVFIEDVEKFIANEKSADQVLLVMQKNYRNYKLAETQLLKNKMRVKEKIPDIQSSLEAVKFLIESREEGENVVFNFPLSDNVYANASVNPSGTVGLWLGANVMVDYTYEEALALLQDNMKKSKDSLEAIQKDLDFVRDQINTTDVNIARIYNFDVKQRRENRLKAAAETSNSNNSK